ncbi:MAG: hypothetical protein ACLQIB_32530 [Isosphaeraceae bacterium]
MGLLDRLFGKPSVANFAEPMIQAFHEAGDKTDLRFDASENRIVRNDPDSPWIANLDNMYQTYLKQPRSRRAEYVRSVARGLVTSRKGLPEEFDLARADLRPRLWLRAAFEQMRLNAAIEGASVAPKAPPFEALGKHLIATLVYNWPEVVQSIDNENVTEWGVSFYEAMEVARENLEEATVSYGKIGDGFYSFMSGDRYDASRPTLVERAQGLEVNGKLVALVPSRDPLFVTGSEDEAGLATMCAMAENHLQEPYSLSGVSLIFEDGTWQDWLPPEGHPLHRSFKQMEITWTGPLYHEQAKLLKGVHEKQGIDIFVATFSALQNKDGELLTYSVWANGVEALLPVTQKDVFMKGEGIPAVFADWPRMLETVGHLMEPTDDCPRRYRVRGFPMKTGSTRLARRRWVRWDLK